MNAEQVANEIRRTYNVTAAQRRTEGTDWMTMETVLDHVAATVDELRAGILWLMTNDRAFFGTEETNQKALSPMAQQYRVVIGRSPVDVMRWM